jgi:diguanylate cyclase (GGDEF)-like protein
MENAGVPPDDKWWSIILYMRSLQYHHYLSTRQKAQIQGIVVQLLKEKDYSEEKYRWLIERQEEVLSSPYKNKLMAALEQYAALMREFENILAGRKGDVQDLQQVTEETIMSGMDPEEAVEKLRDSFASLTRVMEEDAANLELMAKTDPLTGLYNRRGFDEYVEGLKGKVLAGEETLCLLMLDIDHFKKINDTYGHRIGDQALKAVASRIRDTLDNAGSGNHVAGRFGGEEFIVALPDTYLEAACELAEAIRESIENYRFVIRNAKGEVLKDDITITISIGAAAAERTWGDSLLERLIECSDEALYRAKTEGRNRVCRYEPSEKETDRTGQTA